MRSRRSPAFHPRPATPAQRGDFDPLHLDPRLEACLSAPEELACSFMTSVAPETGKEMEPAVAGSKRNKEIRQRLSSMVLSLDARLASLSPSR